MEEKDAVIVGARCAGSTLDPSSGGWATEADAGQDLRDTFSRLVAPSQVTSKERMARWFADAPEPAAS